MSRIECEVYLDEVVRHTSQIISGFLKLNKKKSYSINLINGHADSYAGAYLFARINGLKVIYDLYDNSDINETLHDKCNFYFKRSYLEQQNEKYPKVRPLGFYYAISDYMQELHPLKFYLRNLAGAIMGRTIYLLERKLLAEPAITEHPKILFIPRLWDPDAADIEDQNVRNERIEINKFRIACVEECRKHFHDRFIGGIQPTKFAVKHLGRNSQLIMDKSKTIRGRYINIMKSTDICVSTQGLHKSIPGKIAEYISASRAIVSEPLHYVVTGNFKNGHNFLSFSTVDELITSITTLCKDPEYRLQMMVNNCKYRNDYALTEKIVANSIETVIAEKDLA